MVLSGLRAWLPVLEQFESLSKMLDHSRPTQRLGAVLCLGGVDIGVIWYGIRVVNRHLVSGAILAGIIIFILGCVVTVQRHHKDGLD